MAVLKVPGDVATSPHDSTALVFETLAQRFVDKHGNKWTIEELAAARPANRIRRWVREQYPPSSEYGP